MSGEFALPFKEEKNTLSYKCAYKHSFWFSELNKPSEHCVRGIHLNGHECFGEVGMRRTEEDVCSSLDMNSTVFF